MVALYLLRHAKAAAGMPGSGDRGRPLTPAGHASATAMGAFMAERGVVIDLTLCSAARRAVETWQALAAGLDAPPPAEIEDGLYSCGARGLLDRLRRVEEEATSVLLVAHNPDIQELAVMLAGEGPAPDRVRLSRDFPAGALAAVAADGISWSELGPGRARLVFFSPPK